MYKIEFTGKNKELTKISFGDEVITETNNLRQLAKDIKEYSDRTFGGNEELKSFVSELIK